MKIGIYNIFTLSWFFILFLCGGTFIYLSVDRNLFASDLIFLAKFFVGFLVLITVGLLFFFLYKFRILVINKNKIVSIYPFLFKIETINRTQIKKVKMETFYAFRGTAYRKIIISDLDGTMEISDLEFGNFNNLFSHLKLNQNRKAEIDLEQARSNLSMMRFNIYLTSGLLLFLVFNIIWNSGFHYVVCIFFLYNIIILFALIKRVLAYKRRMKKKK